nr:unnamed protein product [Digitaria exilis]
MSASNVDLESSSADNNSAAENPRERILRVPQDYIGSVDKCTRETWICEGTSMAHREVFSENLGNSQSPRSQFACRGLTGQESHSSLTLQNFT